MNLYESIYRYVILTCRATFLSRSEGLGHAERRPHASWLRQVESYLKMSFRGKPSPQVRSGVGAYAGAARRRVHLATVLLRPPCGHRPGRRQARHARILQIGLHPTQPRGVWAPPRHGPAPRISTKKNPMGGILRRETRHMPIEA